VINVVEEYNRKEVECRGDVARDGRTRNVKRILAEKRKRRSNLGDRYKGRSRARNRDRGYFI